MSNVALGSHWVTEAVPPVGWTFTSLSCADPTGNSGTVGTTANITIDPGETVTCTFTNTDDNLGTIIIVENSVPDAAQSFGFSGDLGLFNLSDGGIPPNSRTVTPLPPNIYSVTESVPGGWDLTGLTCADPSGNSLWNVGTGTADINLSNGETVTCTYTNSRRGTIVVVEDSIYDSAQSFTFNPSWTGPFNLTDDGLLPPSNSRTFTDVPTGTQTVQETVPGGWTLTGLSCADPTGNSSTAGTTANITLDPAETVTCTFTNTDASLGSITVVEDNVPNSSTSFSFTGTSPLGTFSLADSSTTRTLVPPGTYVVTQDPPPGGWDFTLLSCVDPNGGTSTNFGTRTATIVLDYGEDITCTFQNTQRGSIRIYENSMPDDPQSFGFSGSLGSFTLVDDGSGSNYAEFTNLLSGVYTVTETVPGGWSLSLLTCSDPSGGTTWNIGTQTATIDLAPGDNVSCTFGNNYNFPNINIGVPDGGVSTINDGYSWTSWLPTPITSHGDTGWDFVYYELGAGIGINMDFVRIDLSPDGSTWYTVFYYGGGQYHNSNIDAYVDANGETDNLPIPAATLITTNGHSTGVGIDIYALVSALLIPDVPYNYIRITAPVGGSGDGCDVDAIQIY
jgi:hypothetical protein